jgi:hypothetical protein
MVLDEEVMPALEAVVHQRPRNPRRNACISRNARSS